MDITIPEIDRLLVDRFARGNGTVFVGAGVSLASRLPSWKALVDPLKEALGEDARHLDPLQTAEFYEVRHGCTALLQHLMDQLGDARYQLNNTHELLVSLPVQRIYTTNFDNFLEQASQKKLINRHVIHHASQVGLSDSAKLSIVKLHGDLDNPDSIVITARDFHAYGARNPAVADLLKVELQTRTVMFIGYSFNDPNLSMILGTAAAQSGKTAPSLYAIQFKPSALAREAMKARGVTVIELDAVAGTSQAQAQLEAWLHEFRRLVNSFERRKQARDTHRFPGEGAHPRRACSVRCEPVSQRLLAGLSSEYCVIVVTGEAGVGKTHVVVEAARARLQPNNRALWTDGFEQVIWIHRIVRENGGSHSLQRIFGSIISHVDLGFSVEDTETGRRREKIGAILHERRLLVVIEDLDDPRAENAARPPAPQQAQAESEFDEIKAWLEEIGSHAAGRSRIVVTSRSTTLSGFMMEVRRLGPADAGKLIHEHARALMMRRNIDGLDSDAERRIVELTRGNPQAIRLALGLINGTGDTGWLARAGTPPAGADIQPVLLMLLDRICQTLESDPAARKAAEMMVAFPGEEWVPSLLLGRADGDACGRPDRAALRKCVDIGLLDHDAVHDRFFMHRTIKEVLSGHKWFESGKLDAVRQRLADGLADYLAQDDMLCRPEIAVPYWNALVRDEMVKVERCWRIVESLMWWAESRPVIVRFVLLLAHYLDSRFLNGLRVHFVKQALTVLDRQADATPGQRHTSALLRIDALGWTYMEEGHNDLAREQIDLGLKVLAGAGQPGPGAAAPDGDVPDGDVPDGDVPDGNVPDGDLGDLQALACAWKARISATEGKKELARQQIAEARNHAATCGVRHWIRTRVAMTDGDVHLLADEPDGAEQCYLEAEASEERYGGELGYQTDPRVGMALMRKADRLRDAAAAASAVAAARERFVRLAENRHMPTGRLYGEFGLAMIAARERSTRDGRLRLQKILKEIAARQGENNILMKLAKDEYDRMATRGDEPRAASRPTAHQNS